jgi:diguanylate cyclase (GGDEF)-like protein/putative nucleotidyltransferase with HDIG domain/PAS domain S-box-containing protein
MEDPRADATRYRAELEALGQRLHETEQRAEAFRRIVQSIDHHLYINEVLPDGGRRAVFVGPGRDRLLGGTPADGDWGRAWIEAIHPDDRVAYALHTERYRRGENSEVLCRLIGLDGVTRWIRGGGTPRVEGDRIIVEGIVRDATAEVEAEQALQFASRTDALTGLWNRRHFADLLDRALRCAREDDETPGLLLVDVDHFKHVNDGYGHLTGDAVLIAIAERLRGALRNTGEREGDVIARWGWEEFIVLAPGLDSTSDLREIGERLRRAVAAEPVRDGGHAIEPTVSVGGVLVDPACSADVLVDRADRALYAAKRHGRDRTRLFTDLTADDHAMEEPEAIRIAQALSLTASAREGMPELHCEQVADLAGALASVLRLPADMVLRCRLGGWLHDIGKVSIPDRILAKPGALDPAEWQVMRTHAEIGEQIIRRIGAVSVACGAVRNHHERIDGHGYPDGLSGDAIPLEARIVAVSDAYSAITADRVYARGRSEREALMLLRNTAGAHHDADVVDALADALTVCRDANGSLVLPRAA